MLIRDVQTHIYTLHVGFFFQLNLLPPYSLCLKGDNEKAQGSGANEKNIFFVQPVEMQNEFVQNRSCLPKRNLLQSATLSWNLKVLKKIIFG